MEAEFGGVKFKGGKIFALLVALSTLIGGLYGAFVAYKDYTDFKEISDVANELKNDLRTDLRRIEKIIEDVEQNQKQDSRENSADIKFAIKEIKEDMVALEEKITDIIQKTLANPLSQIK